MLLALAGLAALLVAWQADVLGRANAVLLACAGAAAAALGLSRAGVGLGHWLSDIAPSARRLDEEDEEPLHAELESVTRRLAYPLAVLIDELDRCKCAYAAELLGSIEDSSANVTWVLVADRFRLSECLMAEYGTLDEVNKVLRFGFDLSFRLPPRTYNPGPIQRWLDSGSPPAAPPEVTTETTDELAKSEFEELTTEEAVLDALNRAAGAKNERDLAAQRLVDPDVESATRHWLMRFVRLLDNDPRTQAQLLRAYSFVRGIEVLGGSATRDEERRLQGVRWSILEVRWPYLADHLAANPAHVRFVGSKPSEAVPDFLRPLFADPQVQAVVHGSVNGDEGRLDEDGIRAIVSGQ